MAIDNTGIMAIPAGAEQQGPRPAMESPEAEMIFSQLRQGISPKEFSDELLASAEQADPQAVAEFRRALEEADAPPEIIDLISAMVDEVLADPANYAEIRQKYLAQGVTEEVLPEQFDPEFFAALNMAVDQMRGEPAGPQAFAKGGIAELKPIAQALASYGRNGDTMLAHITPAEARMLRSKGGSGTINPKTGLPEFFLKKLFSKIGSAVKSFAKSTVGRVVITAALGFFLGPAAAAAMGVTSAAGVAAVGGFIGGAGSTLAAGGNLREALKAGASGAIVSGVGAGVFGGGTDAFKAGSYQGPTTVSGQLERFQGALTPQAAGAPAAPAAPTGPSAEAFPVREPGIAASTPLSSPYELAPQASPLGSAPRPGIAGIERGFAQPTSGVPTVGQGISRVLEGDVSGGLKDIFLPQGADQATLNAKANQLVAANPRMPYETALRQAAQQLNPSMLRAYGPMAAAGLGIMGLTGGFRQKEVTSPYASLFTGGPGSASDLMKRNPGQYYVQGLPGVSYFNGSVLPPPPPGYADGGLVDEYGNEIVPPTPIPGQDEAAQQTPSIPSTARITTPTSSQIGIPSSGSVEVATPGVGGYNTYSPAAQNLYYQELNRSLLEGPASAAQEPLYFPSGERLAGIEQLYKQNLGRTPDVGGLMFYANPQANFSMADIERSIESSPERQAYLQQQALPSLAPRMPDVRTPRVDPRLLRESSATEQGLPDTGAPAFRNLPPDLQYMMAADGGIASLARGSYPRRTGQISGPGTEKSDSIPAMLSDGEFVMTAKAVRGAGKGSRRAGAKKLYALMHQLERNASRG